MQVVASEFEIADRDIGQQCGGAIGGDLNLLIYGRRLKSNFDLRAMIGGSGPWLGYSAEPGGGNRESPRGVRNIFENKGAGKIGSGGRGIGICGQLNLSAGNGSVVHYTFEARSLRRRARGAKKSQNKKQHGAPQSRTAGSWPDRAY